MKIRYATSSDIEACQQIARQHRDELPFVMRVQLQQSAEKHELLVAELNGALVGFARFHARTDGVHTLYDLAVCKSAQRQGVGAALVMAIPTPIQLKTTVDNSIANQFYRRLGFRLLRTEPSKRRW